MTKARRAGRPIGTGSTFRAPQRVAPSRRTAAVVLALALVGPAVAGSVDLAGAEDDDHPTPVPASTQPVDPSTPALPGGADDDLGDEAQRPASPELLAQYPFDEASGTRAANTAPESEFGAATLTNGAAFTGGAVLLDGNDDYVDLPDDLLTGLTDLTVSLDVRVDPAQAAPYSVYGLGNASDADTAGYLATTGDPYRTAIATGDRSTEQAVGPAAGPARGVWTTLTYTLGGTTATLYEDGVQVGEAAVDAEPGQVGGGSTTANDIGRALHAGDSSLQGEVRDFRIYDGALTADEVAELAAEDSGPDSEPAGVPSEEPSEEPADVPSEEPSEEPAPTEAKAPTRAATNGITSPSAAEPPAALAQASGTAPLECSGDSVYQIQRPSAAAPASNPGRLNSIDVSGMTNGSTAPVTATQATTALLSGTSPGANALGISNQGTAAWALAPQAPAHSASLLGIDTLTFTLQHFNPATGTWTPRTATIDTEYRAGLLLPSRLPSGVSPASVASGGIVAGAVDPNTGNFYWAHFNQAARAIVIFGFNTVTDQPIGVVANSTLPPTGSGSTTNGDMAFDRAGNLYLVTNTGTSAALGVIAGPLPTTAAAPTPTRAMKVLSTFPNPNSNSFNGMAFNGTGDVIVEWSTAGGETFLQKHDPQTGAVLAGPSKVSSTPSGGGIGVDLASCYFPPSLELRKDVVSRAAATDQFALAITGGNLTQGNTATTSGTEPGVQAETAGPVLARAGTTYTFTEAGAGTTDLSSYETTWQCVDSGAGGAVVASGTGQTFTLAPTPGQAIVCTFTNTGTPPPSEFDVYVEKLRPHQDGEDPTPIGGAEFQLLADDNGSPGEPVDTTVEEVEDGRFVIEGLAPGTYWLLETKAPPGYNLLPEAIAFTVDATGSVDLGDDPHPLVQLSASVAGGALDTLEVTNVPVIGLPFTGSGVAPPLVALGATALFAAAVSAAVARRRRLQEEEPVAQT